MIWSDLFAALALVLILEGVMPFVNPRGTRRTLDLVSKMPDGQLRTVGLVSMIVGLVLLYFVRL